MLKSSLNILIFIFLLSSPLVLFSQYTVQPDADAVFPIPGGGVAAFSSSRDSEAYLSKVETYNETGSVGRVTQLPSGSLGNFGDYAWVDQELYVIPSFYVDIDVVADLGFNLLKYSPDSIELVYQSPTQYSNLVAEKSLGIGSSMGHFLIAEGDSLHIISQDGLLINSASFPTEYWDTEVFNLGGTAFEEEYAVIGQQSSFNNRSAVLYLDSLGEVVRAESHFARPLKTWTTDRQSITFFNKGYMFLGTDEIIPYPVLLDTIEAAYDAVEVAVVRNDEGQYFSFTPNDGFISLGAPKEVRFASILKQPEGWYSFVGNALTFNPDSLVAPLANPLDISLLADSAAFNVTFEGPMNTPYTNYTVSYTLQLKNQSADTVRSASIEVVGPFGTYDPFDRSSYATNERVEVLAPGALVILKGEHAYRMLGSIPEASAGVTGCILSINDSPFVGGRRRCSSSATDFILSVPEVNQQKDLAIDIYPNPIKSSFRIDALEEIESLRVVNAQGQLSASFSESPSGNYRFPSSLPVGVYTIQVFFANGEMQSLPVLRQ